ncbi:DUF1667 domain-containing protein [Desnuesiella massiliensis]|uniref:DUF1667 domain-containing protein n=1 Tax=Desnuesiella massiliensis TaxID=1650662 RepID=UPI0006E46B99|nr:DUF1667 domain-containing protein [Desnuesiella massiliensis]
MIYKAICKSCEKKCVLDIYSYEEGEIEVKGNECEIGIDYANEEINNTKKIFTTLVRIKGSERYNVVPVKSSAPIDKKLWIECSKALSRIYVGAPTKIGDVICKNILNTGVDIICARNVEKSF